MEDGTPELPTGSYGNQFSDEEMMQLAKLAVEAEEKQNTYTFLTKVVEEKDTTKLGYLREEEVGIPKLSARTLKELALFCEDVADEKEWADFFKKKAEILTSTSLSKNAKLLDSAILRKTETNAMQGIQELPARKENKGWFGKRKNKYDDYGTQ